MALRDKLRKLEETMRGNMGSFELADGRRHYFDPQEQFKAMFLYFADSMKADHRRSLRPEPPDILRAVAGARDRGEALDLVMGGYSHLPIDREALVGRGKFVPRSLVAGRSYEERGAP